MIARGQSSIMLADVLKVTTEAEITGYYLGITKIPCIIKSPLRSDNHPSFSLYSKDGVKVHFLDFATKERGSIFDLLCKIYNRSFREIIGMIYKDFKYKRKNNICINKSDSGLKPVIINQEISDIKVAVREWLPHDIEYWESYGISLKWLKYADVYPISHKVIYKGKNSYTFKADKYAYAFVEFKENKTTLKIYQPFSKTFKWCNKHDKSVISLWTKVPKQWDEICICSSLKDALCLWSNTGIPAIAIQGEAMNMSKTAIQSLKNRYKKIYILLDNDEAGITNAVKLAEETGFTNVVLPQFEGGKDISDARKALGKKKFLDLILPLFN
jgi:hypothetical protein